MFVGCWILFFLDKKFIDFVLKFIAYYKPLDRNDSMKITFCVGDIYK